MMTDTSRAAPPATVSVVITFLDPGAFLADALASVRAQTYGDWELVLVDDGSTDGSSERARRWAAEDPLRIRYLEHPGHANLGKSASRNAGVRASRGSVVAFLDADDVWQPEKLAAQVALLERHPEAAMTYGPVRYWRSWTGRPRDLRADLPSRLGVPPDTLVQPPELLVRLLRCESAGAETVSPYPSSVLVRRAAFEAVGGFEDAFRNLYDDVVFFAKLFLHAPVFVATDGWCNYRLHPDERYSPSYQAAMATGEWHPARPNPAEQRFLTWLAGYVKQQPRRSPALDVALARSLLPYRRRGLHAALLASRALARGVVRQAARAAQRALPRGLPHRFRNGVGWIQFGSLRRTTPVSRVFGFDRGTPVDRYYIERFLAAHAEDVRGCVLEIADDAYTRRYGGDRVSRSEVLHALPGNPAATMVGDLSQGDGLPADTFDCIILTQTLLCIYDIRAAVRTVYRLLKPGGVALVTVPGICQIAQPDMALWGDYWRFTTLSARRLFEEAFPAEGVQVRSYGNVLVAVAFLHGLAQEELRREELDACDPDYQVSISVRAAKPVAAS